MKTSDVRCLGLDGGRDGGDGVRVLLVVVVDRLEHWRWRSTCSRATSCSSSSSRGLGALSSENCRRLGELRVRRRGRVAPHLARCDLLEVIPVVDHLGRAAGPALLHVVEGRRLRVVVARRVVVLLLQELLRAAKVLALQQVLRTRARLLSCGNSSTMDKG